MASVKQVMASFVCLAITALAAPAPTPSSSTVLSYPGGLPSTYPRQLVNINAQAAAPPVPNHFALFGYSYDGSIVNQSYFANGQPYNKDLWGFLTRPHIDYGNQTYGSYAFGLGPHNYLFAYNDGRIATFNDNDGEKIDTVLFESWGDWWDYKNSGEPADKIPTCEIIPYYDVLYCTLDGSPFKFAWCNETVPYGIGYSRQTVDWGTDISPCTEIVLQTIEVPKGYGDTDPAKACSEFPDVEACQGKGANSTAKA